LFSKFVAQVFIVTGSSSGVGKELAQILHAHDAKVYVAARSKERAGQAMEEIRANFPASKGELVYLHLDLEDLSTIKASAEEFLGKEDRLDVLWNNAGVMNTPAGSKTKQGYELQLGTNNIAPFLFTKLLTPVLVETAKTAPKGSVKVVWVSSSAAEMIAPVGGVDMNNLDYKKDLPRWMKYGVSKGGNILHSNEFAKRHEEDGIISVVG
jgi:retinol dehydrogenase 12